MHTVEIFYIKKDQQKKLYNVVNLSKMSIIVSDSFNTKHFQYNYCISNTSTCNLSVTLSFKKTSTNYFKFIVLLKKTLDLIIIPSAGATCSFCDM